MQTKYSYFLSLALVLSDFLILNGTFYLAFSFVDQHFYLNHIDWKNMLFVVNLGWLVCTTGCKAYQIDKAVQLSTFLRATAQSVCLLILLLLGYVNFLGDFSKSWNFTLTFVTLMPVSFFIGRLVYIKLEPAAKKTQVPINPVSLLELYSTNTILPSFSDKDYDFDGNEYQNPNELVVTDTQLVFYNNKIFKDAAGKGLNELYISITPDYMNATADLQKQADKHGIRLKFICDFSQCHSTPLTMSYNNNMLVISLRHEPLEAFVNILIKKITDIAVSLIAILFVLSWMYPLIALLIMLEGKGPVLFKQSRSGRNGKIFTCYKFRSMQITEHAHVKQAKKHDDRITKIGRILRKTSLDELPQFFNVLMGDMSVVGPRPHMISQTEQYSSLIDKYMVRHYLKPGITGWAQINGYRGETQTLDLMEKRVEHDIWYIENWSTWLDIKIIWKTATHVFKGDSNAF